MVSESPFTWGAPQSQSTWYMETLLLEGHAPWHCHIQWKTGLHQHNSQLCQISQTETGIRLINTIVPFLLHIKEGFSNWGNFAPLPQGTFSNVWRQFWLLPLGMVASSEARDMAKHSAMHRVASTIKNCLPNNSKYEKSWCKGRTMFESVLTTT